MAYTYEQLKGANLKSDPEMLKYLAGLSGDKQRLSRWTSGTRDITKDLSHILEGKTSARSTPGTSGLFGVSKSLYEATDKATNWDDPNQLVTAKSELDKWVADSRARGIDVTSSKNYQDYAKRLGIVGGQVQTSAQRSAQDLAGHQAAMTAAGQDPLTGATIDQAKQDANTVKVLQESGQADGAVDAQGKLIKNPTGNPTEQNNVAGNTLEDIQASPIPPLPAEYGQGSGLDQANWALQHRANIFAAYQKYGITPSAEEVNWQLTHNPDINSIDSSIAQAVQSGQDTRGTMPEGNKAQTDVQAQADTTISNITSTDANGQIKPLADVVKEFADSMGLTDISDQIQAVTDAEADAEMAINENPWLSEAERSKRVQLSAAKFKAKKNALIDRLKLEQDVVAQAVDYYEKDREFKRQTTKDALKQKNIEMDDMIAMQKEANATSTSFQNIGGREVMITYDKQGNILSQTDLGMSGSPKSSGGGGSATTPSSSSTIDDTGMTLAQRNQMDIKVESEAKGLRRQLENGEIDWGTAWNQIYDTYSTYLEASGMSDVNAYIDDLLGIENRDGTNNTSTTVGMWQ